MTFRQRLLNHERLFGILLTFPLPSIAEMCADAGFDWVFLDMEHGGFELADIQRTAQAVNDRCACVVRVPINDRMWIGKVLDLGVSGIIIPQVNSAEDAQRAVHAAKYPPQGGRGVGLGRASKYGANLTNYLQSSNDETALIAQIEHKDAAANVDAIASTPGIDALMLGPFDLSGSFGIPGQLDDPQVQAAVTRVRDYGRANKIPMSIFAPDIARAQRALADGYTLMLVSTDNLIFVRGASDIIKSTRPDKIADDD